MSSSPIDSFLPPDTPCPRHLYVHVPFCRSKCDYCAFYSIPVQRAPVDAYLQALETEFDLCWSAQGFHTPLRTVYIGGGTPTVLSPAQLESLLSLPRRFFDVHEIEEWTVEANPESLTEAHLEVMLRMGVNRLSIGVQSLDDDALACLNRPHTAAQALAAVDMAVRHGFENINIDLIAAIPGVPASVWERTLAQVPALPVYHVSVYPLTIEPETPLYRLHAAGRLHPLTTSAEEAQLKIARRVLKQAGFEQYEVSNYAVPGWACKHNLACWRGADYAAFGPSAASRLGRQRRRHRPSLRTYIRALRQRRLPRQHRSRLSRTTDLTERFMFQFRLLDGVDLDAFGKQFRAPENLTGPWEQTLLRLETYQLACRQGSRWRLTLKGLRLADSVAAEFLPPGSS